MEIFYDRFGKPGRAVLDVIAGLAGLGFAGLLLGSAIRNIPEQIQYREAGDISNIPFWPFSVVIAFCGLVLCLQFLTQMLRPFTGSSPKPR